MTIKEVKKHFKNAKEVENILCIGAFKIKGNYHRYRNAIYCTDTEGDDRLLWHESRGFARITKYKTNEIKVSEDLVKGYHKDACQEFKTRIEKDFPKLFPKTELDVGKWYHWKDYDLLFNLQSKSGRVKSFGFSAGNWYNDTKEDNYWGYHSDLKSSKVKAATDKEVKDALMKEAVKRGFKKGVKVKIKGEEYSINENPTHEHEYDAESNTFFFHNLMIFDNGKWATIIEPPKEIEYEGNAYVLKKFSSSCNNVRRCVSYVSSRR